MIALAAFCAAFFAAGLWVGYQLRGYVAVHRVRRLFAEAREDCSIERRLHVVRGPGVAA